MHITILTLFPDMFSGPLSSSIIGRAIKQQAITLEYINIRDFAADAYGSVDDRPYGGGVGMILRVDVVDKALQKAKDKSINGKETRTILLDPHGKTYTQAKAKELSEIDHLILICAHYEGIDHRIRSLVDEEISIGDYVLTGGEIPAMVLVDSITRLIPGVLRKTTATQKESFSGETPLLEYPQYTRPEIYKDMTVPEILLSGNHAAIEAWQKQEAISMTADKRPDLIG